jgi:hypothetical protein
MRYLKKWWLFWGLFSVVIFAGSLFFLNIDLQNQYSGIPDLSAQGFDYSDRHWAYGPDMMRPSDIMFTYDNNMDQGERSGVLPHDVIFNSSTPYQKSHPGSIIFPNIFPGDITIDRTDGKAKMRTIMTCSGCSQTMATCDWDCGPTFSFCNMGTGYGGGFTGLTCPGSTDLIFGSSGNTSIACPTGIICGSVSNSLMTCSSGGIFCGIGGGTTAQTCYIFGCRIFSVNTGAGNSFMTCGSSLYGVCGGQTGGPYGWLLPYEPGSSPPF